MPLYNFSTKPRSIVPSDLLKIQARIGGTIGQIKSGMEQQDALMVRDNVFVTAKRPSHSLRAMVNLGRADIHTINHPADLQLLVDRLEATEGI